MKEKDKAYKGTEPIKIMYPTPYLAARALDWLELALTERDGWLVNLNSFPRFESLRDEPRFGQLLRRMNLPEKGGY